MATYVVRSSDATAEVESGTTALQALKRLEAIRGQVVAAEVTVAGGEATEWDLAQNHGCGRPV